MSHHEPPPAKVPFSTQISPDLKAAVTATVRGLRDGADPSATVSAFTETALTTAVRAAEDRHHDGQPWSTGQPLPTGRPKAAPADSTESPTLAPRSTTDPEPQ